MIIVFILLRHQLVFCVSEIQTPNIFDDKKVYQLSELKPTTICFSSKEKIMYREDIKVFCKLYVSYISI